MLRAMHLYILYLSGTLSSLLYYELLLASYIQIMEGVDYISY